MFLTPHCSVDVFKKKEERERSNGRKLVREAEE
jgi:hypothetical protein